MRPAFVPAVLLLTGLVLLIVGAAASLELILTESRLPAPVNYHTVVYDGHDSIYVLGGVRSSQTRPDLIVRYSLDSGAVDVIGTFLNISSDAAVIYDEHIFFFGGFNRDELAATSKVHRISTRDGSWSVVNNIPDPTREVTAAWDPRNQVAYVFGGDTPGANGGYLNTVYMYDPRANVFVLVGRLPSPRSNMAAGWDTRRGVAYLLVGWANADSTASKEVVLFDPAGNGSRIVTVLPDEARFNVPCAAYVDSQDTVYAFDDFTSVMSFNATKGLLNPVEVSGWRPLLYGASVYVPRLDRIYILGGFGATESGWADLDHISYISFQN